MSDFEYNNPSQSLCDSSPEVGAEKAVRVLVVTTKRLLRHYQETTKTLPRDYQDTTKTNAEKIKEIMRENPTISAPSIAKITGLSVNGVRYNIKKMKASGEIEREGGDFGGRWKVNG